MRYDTASFVDGYLDSFDRTRRFSFGDGYTPLPNMKDIERMEDEFLSLFFPGHAGVFNKATLKQVVSIHMDTAANLLFDSVYLAYLYQDKEHDEARCEAKAKEVTNELLSHLSEIRSLLKLDAQAGFDGDPAAKSMHEVIVCYPALRAISVHRIAHFLYKKGVPLVPRMMNEAVHSKTGIDIHPGAEIGKSFFIDHGSGVVIGETTIIGDNVKLYQGVTLGALSFPKDGCGQLLKGNIKRHPTICDGVTIYANATILGDITIGEDSTISSNAWIRVDIPPHSRVFSALPEIRIKQKLEEGK